MHTKTIAALNALNQHFYQEVSPHFSQSRQHAWPGWFSLVPLLKTQLKHHGELRIVDIGCGNGRFGKFLAEQLPAKTITYLGLDSNDDLLKIARADTADTFQSATLRHLDLITPLLEAKKDDVPALFAPHKYDVAVLFGVMHHIPSLQLRTQLIAALKTLLQPSSVIVLTTWQFDQDESLAKRMKPLQAVEETQPYAADAEPGDYVLTWERTVHALRYCHLASHEEVMQMINSCGLMLENDFFCDGHENTLNHYYVLRTPPKDNRS